MSNIRHCFVNPTKNPNFVCLKLDKTNFIVSDIRQKCLKLDKNV